MNFIRAASRRGFTLVEAVAAIVVLGILIPPTVVIMRDAAAARVDAINMTRATWLASAVMEQVIADTSSDSLGMSALSDSVAYLTTPSSGLEARLTDVTALYATAGLSWSLTVGDLVSGTGTPAGDAAQDVYRYVEVTVNWNSRTGSRTFQLGSLLTDLHT